MGWSIWSKLMKDYIINNDGKIRICDSNIAKMNIFEYMYYRRSLIFRSPKFIFDQFIEGFQLIGAAIIVGIVIRGRISPAKPHFILLPPLSITITLELKKESFFTKFVTCTILFCKDMLDVCTIVP